MNTQRHTAQTQSLLTTTYKLIKGAELFKAWETAKATMHTFGINPARQALVNSAYAAYIAYMDSTFHEDEFEAIQVRIKSMAESL